MNPEAINGVASHNPSNRKYSIQVVGNQFRVELSTKYEGSSQTQSTAILTREQALALAESLLRNALAISPTGGNPY